MKLSAPSEVELQDVLVVVEEQRKRVFRGQAEKDTSAWSVKNLFLTTKVSPLLLKSFVISKN